MAFHRGMSRSVPILRSLTTAAKVESEGASESGLLSMDRMPREPFLNLLYSETMRSIKKAPSKKFLMIDEMFKKHNSDIFYVRYPVRGNMVFIRNPEDVKTLMVSEDRKPIQSAFDFFVEYRQKIRPDLFPESSGLLGSNGEKWHQVRSQVQPDLMRPKSALYYIDDVTKVSDDLLRLIVPDDGTVGQVEDVVPLLYRWALEAVGTIFLDTRIGCLKKDPPQEAVEMIKHVESVLGDALFELTRLPKHRLYRTKALRVFDEAAEGLHKLSSDIIKRAKSNKGEPKSTNRDEMSVLDKMIDRCGKDSSIPQVMAMDALAAGIDTTGNTSAFLFSLLGCNPDKQEILYQEIQQELGDRDLTPAILNNLRYVKAAVKETTRLRPVAPAFGRRTQKDLALCGYKVPKGNIVVYAAAMQQRSENYFTEADKFIPERWIRGSTEETKVPPFVHLPFGHGSRMCIGRRFAELELQILTIQTVRKFKLVCEDGPVEMADPYLSRPEKPVSVKLVRR